MACIVVWRVAKRPENHEKFLVKPFFRKLQETPSF